MNAYPDIYPESYPENPKSLWQQFYQFTQIPRPSGKEDKIREYVLSIAQKYQLKFHIDTVGNVIIYVPGKGQNKDSETVIIQNHLDMVTDKTPDHEHDFNNDALSIFVENGWVTALNTTLGADNGIGCCAALALLEESNVDHPPLELLFTVDEETGLNGALGLEAKYLSGKRLVNLDTEEWGSAYIGCAGGMEYELNRNFVLENSIQSNYSLSIASLKGGHSGIDIHRNRANAIKLLNQILDVARQFDIRISTFNAGKAHNIIPRDAQVSFYLPAQFKHDFEEVINNIQQQWQGYLNEDDCHYTLDLSPAAEPAPCITKKSTSEFIHLLSLFPHGAKNYYWDSSEPVVSTSNNLAIVSLKDSALFIQTSLRYFDRNEVQEIEQTITTLADTFDLTLTSGGQYPSWKPDVSNPLIDKLKTVYQTQFGEPLEVKAIHAGLECGILKEKIGSDLQAISFGPTIIGAHSPTEAVEIESTQKFWQLFVNFLQVL